MATTDPTAAADATAADNGVAGSRTSDDTITDDATNDEGRVGPTAPGGTDDLHEPTPPPTVDGSVWRYLPYALYVIAAFALLSKLWADPGGRMLADNYQDQVFFEWVLTNGANAIANLDNPLFTEKLNAPYGINLMANTSVLALAIPLAPLTLLAGADVTFVLIETMALAGTAAAWFFVLHRLLNHRVAAAIGGAFCGFAPAMISQAAGHPNIAGQYVLPFIVLVVARLGAPGRRGVRDGLVLAGLVVLQAFINEEVLFLTALAWGIFLLVYAVSRRRDLGARVPGALKSLATTTVVAGVALAYPVYFQFFGRGHYRGLPDYILAYSADLASYWSFSRRSLAGHAETVEDLAQGATEENSFFGWPLLVVVAAVVIWLHRDRVVRALAVTAVVFAVMSLGSEVRINGEAAEMAGPWGMFDGLPLFDSVVPTRLAIVVTPLVGCLLARAAARFAAVAAQVEPRTAGRVMRLQGAALLVAVLLPLAPTPLPTAERPFVPAFFTTGAYRDHIPANGIAMGVPPGWGTALHQMQWQTGAGHGFRVFGGYFLAPNPKDPERVATYGPEYPPHILELDRVAGSGKGLELTPQEKETWLAELRAVQVTTLLMPSHHWAAQVLRDTLAQVVGEGRLVEGVWVWDVT